MKKTIDCYETLIENLTKLAEGYARLSNNDQYHLGEIRCAVDAISSVIKRICFFNSNKFGFSTENLFMSYEKTELTFGTPVNFLERQSSLDKSITFVSGFENRRTLNTEVPVNVSIADGVEFGKSETAKLAKISSDQLNVALIVIESCIFIGVETNGLSKAPSNKLFPREIVIVLSKDCCLIDKSGSNVSIIEYNTNLRASNQHFGFSRNNTVEESWILEIQEEISSLLPMASKS